MSPDKDPVIDKHPKYNNIIIASGFSGMGIRTTSIPEMFSEYIL